MFSARLISRSVVGEVIDCAPDLVRNEGEKLHWRLLTGAKDAPWISHQAELDSKSEPIARLAAFAHDGHILI